MSKKVKTVLAVAAAVAVPFVAPMIATSIGVSGALAGTFGATAGGAIGGALTGAALGGLTGAASERYLGVGDWRSGATSGLVGGAVSGGLQGYQASTVTPTTTAPVGPTTAPPVQNVALDYVSPLEVSQAATAPVSATPGMATSTGTTIGLSGAPATTPVQVPYAPGYTPEPSTAGGFTEVIGQVPGRVAERFTNPEVLTDIALRTGGALASSALAGSGMSKEQEQALQAERRAIVSAGRQQQALNAQRQQQANELMRQAEYYDPEYFGRQRARQAQIAGGVAKRAGLRGMTGDRREAEERRYDLATAREAGTRYEQGFLTGLQGRQATIQAGLAALPTADYSYAQALRGLGSTYGTAKTQADAEAKGIADLFGSITGAASAKSRG